MAASRPPASRRAGRGRRAPSARAASARHWLSVRAPTRSHRRSPRPRGAVRRSARESCRQVVCRACVSTLRRKHKARHLYRHGHRDLDRPLLEIRQIDLDYLPNLARNVPVGRAIRASEVQMRGFQLTVLASALVLIGVVAGARHPVRAETPQATAATPQSGDIQQYSARMIEEGRHTFRYATFGDEVFWGDTLKLHRAIAGSKLGGVGPGVSPKTALSVGLKVDADAVPAAVADALKAGKVDLDDPASTMVLLKANAVVGVTGHFGADGNL